MAVGWLLGPLGGGGLPTQYRFIALCAIPITMSSIFRFADTELSVYGGPMTKIGDKIRERREALGWSMERLGAETGYSQPAISDMENGETVGPRKWKRLAYVLGIELSEFRRLVQESRKETGKTKRELSSLKDAIDSDVEVPPFPKLTGAREFAQDRKVSDKPLTWGDDFVPVYGKAAAAGGAATGQYEFNGDVIGWEPRPSKLAGVPDAYAVYVDGDSMYPRYKAGETVWVNPNMPSRSGADVVVQVRPSNGDGPPLGFIKEFVARTPTKLVLLQHNPRQEIEIDLDDVVAIHSIVFAER